MLKMIISCGLGMSSSALAVHMQKEIVEKGWENKVQVEFLPFPLLMTKQEELDADIAILCPHLMYYAKNESKNEKIKIPMYIIPSLMYGKMELVDLMEDAEDLLALNQNNNEKLWHFEEEKLLDIKRNISHRRWIKTHPIHGK
ncbi:MAG: hypothetical protein RR562_11605 [Longicatena sp.]